METNPIAIIYGNQLQLYLRSLVQVCAHPRMHVPDYPKFAVLADHASYQL